MKLSVKSDYATRAVLALARHYPNPAAVPVESLAAAQDVAPGFLIQILIELKSRQIVKSVRGKLGGYLLARPPAEITFGDVLRAVHGQVFDTPALADGDCPPELRAAWRQVQTATNAAADAINFQQLVEAGQEKEKMYYI